MPFNINTGVYTPPAGATSAATGQVIQSAVWNTIHADISTALTTTMQQVMNTPCFQNIMAPNGGFEVWQRGAGASASITVAASSTVYTADRWYLATGANQACNVAAAAGLAGNAPTAHAAQVTRSSGQTGTGTLTFGYPLDTDEINRIRNSNVTLRFMAKTGANWSPSGGVLQCALYVGTGGVSKRGAGFTSETTVVIIPATLVAGSGAMSFVGQSGTVIPVGATQGEVQFTWTPTGTAGGADTVTFDQVDLSVGTNVELPFVDIPFDVCLQMCKRHFQKTFAYGTAPAQSIGAFSGEVFGISGFAGTTAVSGARLFWRYSVPMRATPTATSYNPSNTNSQVRDESATADCSGSSVVAFAESLIVSATPAASTSVGNLLGVHLALDAGI